MTVREAAVQVDGSPQTRKRQAGELIQKIEGIGRSRQISIGWQEMEQEEITRLKNALRQIVGTAASLLNHAPNDTPPHRSAWSRVANQLGGTN